MYYVKIDDFGNIVERAEGNNPFGNMGVHMVSKDIIDNADCYKYVNGVFIYKEQEKQDILYCNDKPTQDEIDFAEFVLAIDEKFTVLESQIGGMQL